MSFTQSTFAPVGPQSAAAPSLYSYLTSDSSAVVAGTDYFIDKAGQLNAGDLIYVESSDSSGQYTVNSDLSTVTPLPAPATLTNVTAINSVDDFPDPIAGEIELTAGLSVVYELASKDIDIGSNVFIQTGGECVIRGSNRFESRLTTSSTSDLITVTNGAFALEFVAITCPNSDYAINFTSTAGFNSLVLQNPIFSSCKSIARVDGAFTTSLRTCTSVTTTVGGIDWIGSNNVQINCTNFLGIGDPVGWVGTLLNLGTATFDLINITGDNRFDAPSGTITLGGAAANANLNPGGRALVAGGIFNGAGTTLSGIDTQDNQWTFRGNVFEDGTTKNTRSDADAYLLTPITVANAGANVFTPIAGVNWLSDIDNAFTVSTAGIVTYTGLDDIDIGINGACTVEKNGGGADLICCEIAIDTGSGLAVVAKTVGCTENATATQISSQGLFTLETGDSFQLWVAIDDAAAGIDVTNARLIVVGG